MNKRAKLMGLLAAVLIGGLVLSACAQPSQPAPTPPPAAKEVVKLTGGSEIPKASLAFAPYVSIGQYLGWFKEDGLDITFNTMPTPTAFAALLDGTIDFQVAAPETILIPESQGQKTDVVIGFNYYSRPWFWLAVMKNSPITKVSELKGKKIGACSPGPPCMPHLELYLKDGGLTKDNVEIINIGSGISGAEALRSGQIDAFESIGGNFADFENAGFEFRYFPVPARETDLFGPNFYVHKRSLDNPAKREALGRYFRDVAKSLLFNKNNPEAVVRMHWATFPEARPTGISEDQALKNGMHTLAVVADHTGEREPGKWGYVAPDLVKKYAELLGVADKVDPNRLSTDAFVKTTNDFNRDAVTKFAKEYKFK